MLAANPFRIQLSTTVACSMRTLCACVNAIVKHRDSREAKIISNNRKTNIISAFCLVSSARVSERLTQQKGCASLGGL